MSEAFRRLRESLSIGEMAAWPADTEASQPGSIFDALAIRPTHLGPGAARAEMVVDAQHLNQRGLCQGGAIVTLADATAAWATYCLVPDGHGFTTLELHTNLIGTARKGDVLVALARSVHAGRSTAVLSVEVLHLAQERLSAPNRRLCAMFTCTQSVLLPR